MTCIVPVRYDNVAFLGCPPTQYRRSQKDHCEVTSSVSSAPSLAPLSRFFCLRTFVFGMCFVKTTSHEYLRTSQPIDCTYASGCGEQPSGRTWGPRGPGWHYRAPGTRPPKAIHCFARSSIMDTPNRPQPMHTNIATTHRGQVDHELRDPLLVPVSKRDIAPYQAREGRVLVLPVPRGPLAGEHVARRRRREVDMHRQREPERPCRYGVGGHSARSVRGGRIADLGLRCGPERGSRSCCILSLLLLLIPGPEELSS